VVQSANGHVIDDAAQVAPGEGITVTLKKGVITATTTSKTGTTTTTATPTAE
jgi:exodeoxyribonuclease VII large subunit